jgi:hypothetical protein
MHKRLIWSKSSYTSATAQCVEVAFDSSVVWIRDSKDTSIPHVHVSAQGWERFQAAICADETLRPW